MAVIEDKKTAKIEVMKHGPLIVYGPFDVELIDGTIEKSSRKTVAFCRCGASKEKPYCDGSHRDIRFRD